MKTLKQILELYKPKSQDEDKFVRKHIVVKHKDRNGNGDPLFQATNIKAVDRKSERHGYEPGQDEEVYEEVEQIDELNQSTIKSAAIKAAQKKDEASRQLKTTGNLQRREKLQDIIKRKSRQTTRFTQAAQNKPKDEPYERAGGVQYGHARTKTTERGTVIVKEESGPEVHGYVPKGDRQAFIAHMVKGGHTQSIQTGDPENFRASANPNHGATKTHAAVRLDTSAAKEHAKKFSSFTTSVKEEYEYIEEKLKVSDGIGAWISDFVHSKNPKFDGFSKRKRMKMAQAAFYSAQRGD